MGVSAGTSNPAIWAILGAGWPTHLGLTVQLGVSSSLPSASFCASLQRYALRAFSSAMTRSRKGASATTACSLEQTVPKSKDFPSTIFPMASATSGGALEHHRYISRSYAKGRLPTRIGRFHDAVPARRQDHAGALMPHQGVGSFERRRGDALDDIFRRSCFQRGVVKDTGRLTGAPLGIGMRAEHNRVARLQRNQALVNGRGRGIGGRENGRNHPYRNTDLGDLLFRQLAQMTPIVFSPRMRRGSRSAHSRFFASLSLALP